MSPLLPPILLFLAAAGALGAGLILVGLLLGPKRSGSVKEMPYESGMDPIHDARRRFDVRFHLVAIAFLLFDVEILFLYPWAVANKHPDGLPALAIETGTSVLALRGVVFAEVLLFVLLLGVGLVYAWRRGVFQWR